MLIFLQYIYDCLIESRPRANSLREVRRRLSSMESPREVTAKESASALRQRALREELSARIGGVVACTRCVRPRSRDWPGGDCCSGPTEELFDDEELASLKLAGATPRHFRTPKLSRAHRATHAGCLFRGPTGCSLPPSRRPTLCIRYTCFALQRELAQRVDGDEINRLQAELGKEFAGFIEQRRARRLKESFDALEASLCDPKSH